MTRSIPTTAGLLGLLTLAGCGPAAIGAGLASAGGGGGSTVSTPSASAAPVSIQPFDTMTVLDVLFTQADAAPVKAKAFFTVGGVRQQIPEADLMILGGQGPAALAFDANGEFDAPSAPAGAKTSLVWNHLATTGQPEVRGVTVDLEFRAPSIDVATPSKADVLVSATVGRDVPTLENAVVSRASTSDESAFELTFDYLDWADDINSAVTSWEFEYSLSGSGTSWAPAVNAQEPTSVEGETVDPNGRIRRKVTFQLDPLALAIPFGNYPNLRLRVNAVEEFGAASRFPLSVPSASNQVEGTPTNAAVGILPAVTNLSIRDPGALGNNPDPNRPWFNVPITATIQSRASQPVEVTFSGRYRLAGELNFRPMTLTQGDRPDTQLVRTFDPDKPTPHFLSWNVLRDVGLGVDSAQNLLADAELIIQFVPPAGTGQPLSRTDSIPGGTTIITTPFAQFQSDLVRDGESLASSSEGATTRDVFLARLVDVSGSIQERELLLDQQFRARQIPAAGSLLTTTLGSGGITGGINRILATDIVPNAPDCIIDLAANERFWFVQWPIDPNGPNNPTATQVNVSVSGPQGNGALRAPPTEPIQFSVNGKRGSIFLDYLDNIGAANEVTVRINLIREAGGVVGAESRDFTFPVPRRPNGNPVDIFPQIVAVEPAASSPPASAFEFVVGNMGCEYATNPNQGILHLLRVTDNGTQLVIAPSSTPLAKPPLPAGDPNREIANWLLSSWQPDNGEDPGLVLVRDLNGSSSSAKEFEAVTLSRAGGSFAASWQPLGRLEQSRLRTESGFNRGNLAAVFSKDLDGNFGGFPGSDLTLVFTSRRTQPSTPPSNKFQVWVYSQSQDEFRPAVPLTSPFTPETLNSNFRLIDVNGDSALDLLVRDVEDPSFPVAGPNGWSYLPSSLTGVSAGFSTIDGVNNTQRARRPALIDDNSDGQQDIVTGGNLYLGQPNGEFVRISPALSLPGTAAPNEAGATYTRSQFDLDDEGLELLVVDAGSNLRRLVKVPAPNSGGVRIPVEIELPAPQTGFVAMTQFMTPSSSMNRSRDLLVFAPASSGPDFELFRASYDRTTMQFNLDSTPLFPGTARGFATVRRGDLPSRTLSQLTTNVEDVAIYSTGTTDQILVLDSQNNYQATTIFSYPQGERVLELATASVSGDVREDILALTEVGVGADRVYRIYAFLQTSAGFSGASAPIELVRFQPGYPDPTLRGFSFDQTTRSFARGILLIDNRATAPTDGEVRIIQPAEDIGGNLIARIIRSPLDEPIETPLSMVVSDSDGDGLIEVVSGNESAIPNPRGLLKLDRGFRR